MQTQMTSVWLAERAPIGACKPTKNLRMIHKSIHSCTDIKVEEFLDYVRPMLTVLSSLPRLPLLSVPIKQGLLLIFGPLARALLGLQHTLHTMATIIPDCCSGLVEPAVFCAWQNSR